MQSLLQILTELSPQILETLHFRKIADRFEPNMMDYSHVDFENPELRVRFFRDRFEISLNFGSVMEPDVWWDEGEVWTLIGIVIDRSVRDQERIQITNVCSLLESNYASIVTLFGSQKYEQTKIQMLDGRRQAILEFNRKARARSNAFHR